MQKKKHKLTWNAKKINKPAFQFSTSNVDKIWRQITDYLMSRSKEKQSDCCIVWTIFFFFFFFAGEGTLPMYSFIYIYICFASCSGLFYHIEKYAISANVPLLYVYIGVLLIGQDQFFSVQQTPMCNLNR